MSRMIEEGHLTITLQELITSGCLSNCTITTTTVLKQNKDPPVCSPTTNNDATNRNDVNNLTQDDNNNNLRYYLNATKLSLLLVQTVARCGNDESIDYFKSLTLNNFIVHLTCHKQQEEGKFSKDDELDCNSGSNVVAILRGGDDIDSDDDNEGDMPIFDDHPLDFDVLDELDENVLTEYFSSDNDSNGYGLEEEKKESLSSTTTTTTNNNEQGGISSSMEGTTYDGQGETNYNVEGRSDNNDNDDALLHQPLDFKSEPTFSEDDPTLDILSNFFTGDNVGGGRRKREGKEIHNDNNTTYAKDRNNNELWNDENERDVVITTRPYARRSSLISHASSQQSSDKEKFDTILKTNGYSVHWTIVGMGIHVYENNVHPSASSSRVLPQLSPENFMLQIMGRLIYDIFVREEGGDQQQGTTLPPSRFLGMDRNLYNRNDEQNPYAFNNGMNNEFEQEEGNLNTHKGKRSSMSFTFGSSNHAYNKEMRIEEMVRMDDGRSSSYTFGSDEFNQAYNEGRSSSYTFGSDEFKMRNTNQADDAQRLTKSLPNPCPSYLPQRTNKRMHKEEKSLFSELIERGHPISICRFLSDMIDIGIDGMADSPYTTLQDVIHDLTQMSTDPELFLYNPEEGFSSNLRFGVGCYGRESQVASILGLASKLEEESNTEQDPASSPSSVDDKMQAIFVSGIAGSGKSFLAHTAAKCLKIRGRSAWIVLGAKFEMANQHESRNVVSSVFDTLVTDLSKMRDGGVKEDIEYSQRAIKAISDSLDRNDMSSLASFIPRIQDLVRDDITTDEDHRDCEVAAESDEKFSSWRLVFLLSSLLGALVTLDRRIMIYYDDLQWCDQSTSSLICEVILSLAKNPAAKNRFLFMGLYRDDEIADSPFMKQYEGLKKEKNINTTNICLPALTKSDITNMLMVETRLPRRLIHDFSSIIFRKTSGHALFITQLLNSIVRDSVIVYSPTKYRYYWDNKHVESLQMGDSVASLIVSNLSSFSETDLHCLRVLSCLGSAHQSIIQHLGSCTDGAFGEIISSLPHLIDVGIIEISSSSMIQFSHDLIHQQVYNDIAIDMRHQMHLDIGLTIGCKTTLDFDGKKLNSSIQDPLGTEISGNDSKNATSASLSTSAASIATHHINNAAEVIVDHSQRVRFACWNAVAANQQSSNSNFQSALHYYKKGIEFLGGWASDRTEISMNLHKGIAATLLSLGKEDEVAKYATIIINKVPFDRSLDARYLLIRSMQQAGKNRETVDMVIALLRKLGFAKHIPSAPHMYFSYLVAGVSSLFSAAPVSPISSAKIVKESITRIDELSVKYNLDHCIDRMTLGTVDKSKRDILGILECILLSGLRMRSPYLPMIVCEMISYSLEQDCLCGESALSFCSFGYMKMWLEDDWEKARLWGKMAARILDKAKRHQPFTCTRVTLFTYLLVWDRPLQESARDLFTAYEMGMKLGEVESASLALMFYLRYSFLDGEMNLWTLKAKHDFYLVEIMKYNKSAAKNAILDSMNIHLLMGLPCNAFAIFDGKINNEEELLEDEIKSNNLIHILGIYFTRFFGAAWMGNMKEANEAGKKAASFTPKMSGPMTMQVLYIWINGLVQFQLFRDGEGDAHFDEGKEMLKELEKYEQRSMHIAKRNMLLLLQAEFYASNCEVNKAKTTYRAAIQSSRAYNYQGLAYEKLGNYLSEICEVREAEEMHKNAYVCYMQWGAQGKAEKVLEQHPFKLSELEEAAINSLKRGRVE